MKPLRFIVAALLLVCTAVYWLHAVKAAKTATLETDEVFTLWMVRDAPSVTTALKAGADTAPPTFYYLTEASCKLFGFTPLGLRFPSLVGMFLFVASIFFFLRKYVGWAVAGAAALLPLFGAAQSTEINARPYAIVMACFVLVCLIWCDDDSEKPPLRNCVAMVLLLGLALCMHFYSVVIVPLMVFMELVWTVKHRIIRRRIWATIMLGAGTLVLQLPVILPIFHATHNSAKSPGYYALPTIASLTVSMMSVLISRDIFFVAYAFVLMGAFCRLWQNLQRDRIASPTENELPRVQADSLGTVGVTAVLYPVAVFVFAVLVTRVYNLRYIYPSAFALSLAFALACRYFRWPRYAEFAILIFVTGLYTHKTMYLIANTMTRQPLEKVISQIPGNAPVILPSGYYFALAESPDPIVRERTTYLLLPDGVTDPNTEPARIARVWMKYKPELHIYENQEFLAKYPTFYILDDGIPGQGLTAWATSSLHTRTTRIDRSNTLIEVSR